MRPIYCSEYPEMTLHSSYGFEDQISLFHTGARRDSASLFDSEFDDNLGPQSLCKEFCAQVDETECEMEKLSKKRQALILAACKCMRDSVLCNLSKKLAETWQKDFDLHGFRGKHIQEALHLIKEKFFSEKDENGSDEWTKGIECVWFNASGNWKESLCYGSHALFEFNDRKTGKRFCLRIPILDNTKFTYDNYTDKMLGRYVLSGDITRDLAVDESIVEFEEDGRKMLKFNGFRGGYPTRLADGSYKVLDKDVDVSAKWKATDIARDIMRFVTTDKLDNSRVEKWRKYIPTDSLY